MLAAAGLLLAACGGDDDDDAADPPAAGSAVTDPSASVDGSAAGEPTTTITGSVPPTSAADTAPAGTPGASAGTEEDFVATGAAALNLGDPEVDRCIIQATIDAIGFENIQATGLTPDELFSQDLAGQQLEIPEDRQQVLQEQVAGCGDLIQLLEDSDAPEEEKACGREHLTTDVLAQLFVVSLTRGEPSPELRAATDAMTACVTEGTAGG